MPRDISRLGSHGSGVELYQSFLDCLGNGLSRIGGIQAVENFADLAAHGALADEQEQGDFLVTGPTSNQLENFFLSGRKKGRLLGLSEAGKLSDEAAGQ